MNRPLLARAANTLSHGPAVVLRMPDGSTRNMEQPTLGAAVRTAAAFNSNLLKGRG